MKKILIVDDDTDILAIVELLLTEHGYTVHTIIDPSNIKEEIKTFIPDVILMDVNMGPHDGRNICRLLKADINFKHIPIILFSANLGIKETYLACDAADFIPKPFVRFELVKIIERHFQVA